MTKILVTRKLPGDAIERLKPYFDEVCQWTEDRPMTRDELKSYIKDMDGVVTLLSDKVDKEFMDAAPKLKIISQFAVGLDNVDVAEATRRGIMVCNTPGVLTDAVAELAMALMLGITKRMVESDKFMRAGNYKGWAPELLLGTELNGKTLGVIGSGRIGVAVGTRAKSFGMKIIYNDVTTNIDFEAKYGAKYEDLATLIKQSDIITIHCPMLPTTKHLFNEEKFNLMKPTAYLINTARGPIIDEAALVKALQQKKIAGAALDVFEFEPKMVEGLKELDNVIVLPHLGSATIETRTAMANLAGSAIKSFFEGKVPGNIFNKDVLKR